jgi:hypothetical protein
MSGGGANYGVSGCIKAGKISGMATVTFDTLDAMRKLREAGFDEKQAEAVVRVLSDAQAQTVTREHFDARIELLRTENTHTRWMVGIVIAIAIANFAKQFF